MTQTKKKMPASELVERLGTPIGSRVLAGSAAHLWELDPDGRGIGIVRVAGAEVDGALAQIEQLLILKEHGPAIRQLVVSIGLSGNRRFHERPDLLLIEESFETQPAWCDFIAMTEPSRISREPVALTSFLSFMAEHDIDLVLATARRRVDPRAVRTSLLAERASADRERLLVDQVHAAMARAEKKDACSGQEAG
jgi:hypothetical protein